MDHRKSICAMQKSMEKHRLGVFQLLYNTCTIQESSIQRNLDNSHVEKLKDSFLTDGVTRIHSLLAIYHGDSSDLPEFGEDVANAEVTIISGQHRVAALLKLDDNGEKYWTTTLYSPSMSVCHTTSCRL
jgi:hypothetical protein